jgi:hypothetical protein
LVTLTIRKLISEFTSCPSILKFENLFLPLYPNTEKKEIPENRVQWHAFVSPVEQGMVFLREESKPRQVDRKVMVIIAVIPNHD